MQKGKKTCTFTLRPETKRKLMEHCKKTAYTMSAFVDIAVEEKLEREKK